MKNGKFKSIVRYLCSLCISFSLIGAVTLFFGIAKAFDGGIPVESVTYTAENGWQGTLNINEDSTVKFSGVSHASSGESGSPISIKGNSTVNLVFEGANILSGNVDVISSGIEVEAGSTVNIYGLEGSSLNVTGGRYGAGIGGIGYSAASTDNPTCGNINIYSGNITAIGGVRGAGIGSGYHSSASNINIYGGNITALGTECAAGIGTGYGTSGGAAFNNSGNPTGSGVGFYNAGNITISGGTVKAASYHINFDNFNQYDKESLYSEGYSDSFAAGIGGGYGASSGNIIIEGNADVTALGACGGAGIGSGRGTSKTANYDSANFDVNVTIRGDSKVVAMATDDRREGVVGDDGGAAIGLGRGCTLDGEPKGTVKIEGNAKVYVVASDHAQAIGGSCVVGKFTQSDGVIMRPGNAALAELTIGDNATVTALSDGNRKAIQFENAQDLDKFVSLDFCENYFLSRSDFFTSDKFPVKIWALNSDNTDSKTMFAVQNTSNMNCMVYIPNTSKYNFMLKDYKAASNQDIFLSNSLEENSAQFFVNSSELKEYSITGLTASLYGTPNISYGDQILAVQVEAPEGIFEYGSNFSLERVEDQTAINELNVNLDQQYIETIEDIIYFKVGALNHLNEVYSSFSGGNIKVLFELPEGWENDVNALFVAPLEDETFNSSRQIENIGGKNYLSFRTNHLGNYAVFRPATHQENNGEENNNQGENNNNQEQSEENHNQSIKNDLDRIRESFETFINQLNEFLKRIRIIVIGIQK